MSPTARTLEWLTKRGWICCVVERWLPGANVRRDAFGFADVLAAKAERCKECDGTGWHHAEETCPGCGGHLFRPGALLVQVTTSANAAARRKKILASTEARKWLAAGNRITVHGWRKSAKSGRWEVTEREVTEADFAEETAS